MFLTVLEFLWWLQPDPGVGGPAPASPSGAPAGAAASGGPDYMMTIAMVGVMLFVFYFFLIRPENQRRQKHEEMVASLRKGTKVRTSGGILGEVVSVNGEELVLKIADKVRINVLANKRLGPWKQTERPRGWRAAARPSRLRRPRAKTPTRRKTEPESMDRGWYTRFAVVVISVIAALAFLWPSVSQWVPAPPIVTQYITNRIAPGLDIRGGLRMMYSVEIAEAIRSRRRLRADQLLERIGRKMDILDEDEAPTAEQLAEVRERVRIQGIRSEDRQIRVTFEDPADMQHLDRDLIRSFVDLREVTGSRSDDGGRRHPDPDRREHRPSARGQRHAGQGDDRRAHRRDGPPRGLRPAERPRCDHRSAGADESDFQNIREIISRTARLEFKIAADDQTTWIRDSPRSCRTASSSAREPVRAGNQQAIAYFLFAEGDSECPDGLQRKRAPSAVGPLAARALRRRPRPGRASSGRVRARPRAFRPDDSEVIASDDGSWRTYYLNDRADVTGDSLDDASVGVHPQTQMPIVNFRMNAAERRAMSTLTGNNVGRRMAVVLDDKVASAPNIESRIASSGMITRRRLPRLRTLMNEATDLTVVLRAGALPAPITPQNEQLIGRPSARLGSARRPGRAHRRHPRPDLHGGLLQVGGAGRGRDGGPEPALPARDHGRARRATLTLPGIAGIALTVGMAVDANVLITERIREELRMGKSARAAVDQGYRKAFWSIFDSQLTTFIAGVVLASYGSGPIRGFANTLMIGIITSLFTGVFCSRVMFDWIVRGLRVRSLRVG